MAPCVARDRWHRAWPLREILGSFLTIYMEKININGAGGRVTEWGVPGLAVSGDRRPWWAVGCPVSVGAPSVASVAARSMANVAVRWLCGAPCVARSLFLIAQNVALRGLCCDFCQNSSEPRFGRSLRPIVFSTLVSYRAGRCLRT